MSIALLAGRNAFLPEVMAYEQYLTVHGLEPIRLSTSRDPAFRDAQAAVAFMGFVGRWKRWDRPLVCDFASRSTRFPRAGRDAIKVLLGKPPDLGVYQSFYVQARCPKGDSYCFRDMGYFPELVHPRSDTPEWDVVYVGETRRPGLVKELQRLSNWGLSVAVAGPQFPIPTDVIYLGTLGVSDTYAALANSQYGLNYLPSKSPYVYQQSTKLIEYAAAGLEIISTRTPWVENFLEQRGGAVAWLDEVNRPADLLVHHQAPQVEDLAWPNVMDRTGLAEWLKWKLAYDQATGQDV